jgi:hypothetical protein
MVCTVAIPNPDDVEESDRIGITCEKSQVIASAGCFRLPTVKVADPIGSQFDRIGSCGSDRIDLAYHSMPV